MMKLQQWPQTQKALPPERIFTLWDRILCTCTYRSLVADHPFERWEFEVSLLSLAEPHFWRKTNLSAVNP